MPRPARIRQKCTALPAEAPSNRIGFIRRPNLSGTRALLQLRSFGPQVSWTTPAGAWQFSRCVLFTQVRKKLNFNVVAMCELWLSWRSSETANDHQLWSSRVVECFRLRSAPSTFLAS